MLRSRTRLFDLGYVVTLGVTMIWLRRFEIRQLGLVNPDEADLLAAGKRAALSLIPYEKFTTTTYGPVWPIFLGVLHKLGLPLTIPAAHLLAITLAYITCVCLFFLFTRILSRPSSALFAAGLGVIWAAGGVPHDVDFIQMASELLPLSLLSIGLCIAVLRPQSWLWQSAGLVVIGAAPLAKYQFIPICLAAGIFLAFVGRDQKSKRRSTYLMLFLSFASSGLVLLLATLLSGNVSKIFDEGIPAVTDYVGGDAPGFLDRLTNASAFYIRYPFFTVSGLVAFALIERRVRVLPRRSAFIALLLSGLVLILGVMSTAITPFPFPHYAYMLLASSVLLTAMCAHPSFVRQSENAEQPGRTNGESHARIVLIAASVFFALASSYSLRKASWLEDRTYETSWAKVFTDDGGRPAANRATRGDIDILCPPGSEAFVWGWAAEMYSYFDWTPASRFTISTWQLNPTDNQETFKQTLASELIGRPPQCIAEAIGPGFFKFTDFSQALTVQIPSLEPLIERSYRKEIVTYRSVIGEVPLILYVNERRTEN